MKNSIFAIFSLFSMIVLSGCQATGEQYEASVYQVDQLNQQQQAETIKIIGVLPAKIEINNSQAQDDAQKAGMLLGSIAGALLGNGHGSDGALVGGIAGGVAGGVTGSMVENKVLVNGVTITYSQNERIYTSTQVGKMCQFQPGIALVVSTKQKETRVQPNAVCPVK